MCSAFARLSFLHWFRDQSRLGRYIFRFFFDRYVFIMRFWFVRKALMTALGVHQVESEQTGNFSFSFVRWFRDPLPPGHQGTIT